MNFFSDEKEWKWLFKHAIDWERILPLYYTNYPTEEEFESQEEVIEFLEEMMGTIGQWCGEVLSERAQGLDSVGAGVVKDGKTFPSTPLLETYKEACEMGFHGLCLPKKFGGMELPAAMQTCQMSFLARACPATMTQLAFFPSIADMLSRFADDEDKTRLIPKIIQSEISGAMCLTEPNAGSDVGAIKTTAIPQADGTYLLNGSKTFITNGGGGINLVLARIKGSPEGTRGLSIFLVEQEMPGRPLNYRVVKNEHKMGLNGSFTTEILYESSVAKLLGEKNKGFLYMLHLMNSARLVTAMQGLGGVENALYHARKYAQERKQFSKPIAELPLMKRNLEEYETERDALRALLVDTVTYMDIYQRLDLKVLGKEKLTKSEKDLLEKSKIWSRKRTPLLKYYATEMYTHLSTKCIQVLGGYGYMKEYPLERIHRDSFGPLLYEGTSQIQALMALKDLIKYALTDTRKFFFNIFFKHPGQDLLRGSHKWEKEYRQIHYNFKKKMMGLLLKCLNPPKNTKLVNPKKWVTEEKVEKLMEHAETLCQGLTYMETLRVLAEHSNKDEKRSDLFFRYKKLIAPRLQGIYTDWTVR
jgi:alkylation response protein AidB-like acyl-CoA dehydrogenase